MLDTFVYELKYGKSHVSLPLLVHTLQLCVYTHIYSQERTNYITRACLYEPMLCKLTFLVVPLQVLTLRTSVYACNNTHLYIDCMIDTFVQEPTVRIVSYVCARASGQIQNLFVYI